MDELRKQWYRHDALARVRQSGRALKDVPEQLKGDRMIVMAAVSENGSALEFAGPDLKCDYEVVMAAVVGSSGSWRASLDWPLQFASPALQLDQSIVLAAVSAKPLGLQHVAKELRSDRAIVLAAVSRKGSTLRHAAPECQCDREVVLAAVSQDGLALSHAAAELREDREVVSAAVSQNGMALSVSSKDCRGDRGIVSLAIMQNVDALQYAGDELLQDALFAASCKQQFYIIQVVTLSGRSCCVALPHHDTNNICGPRGLDFDDDYDESIKGMLLQLSCAKLGLPFRGSEQLLFGDVIVDVQAPIHQWPGPPTLANIIDYQLVIL